MDNTEQNPQQVEIPSDTTELIKLQTRLMMEQNKSIYAIATFMSQMVKMLHKLTDMEGTVLSVNLVSDPEDEEEEEDIPDFELPGDAQPQNQ